MTADGVPEKLASMYGGFSLMGGSENVGGCLEVFRACFQVKSSVTQEQGTVNANPTAAGCCG